MAFRRIPLIAHHDVPWPTVRCAERGPRRATARPTRRAPQRHPGPTHPRPHPPRDAHAGAPRPRSCSPRRATRRRGSGSVQRRFGSQRALKTVEDLTEFEQRSAYFDGDPVIATKKGVNILERGSQVHFMAEFQAILDFPPAPKLGWDGRLEPEKASESEMQGQQVFFGRGKCSSCHPAPYYTDNLMHNLKAERFCKPQMINGRYATSDGPSKTFQLRGIKASPPYLHAGPPLTLDVPVELLNLALGL